MAQKSVVGKKVAGMGVGVTAALVSAAGAYFLYGSKNAVKNRKLVKNLSTKAKKEVVGALEKAKDMSKEDYERLVDKTMISYKKMKGIGATEIAHFAHEMKTHWKNIEKKGQKHVVKPAKAARKTAKKAVAKVAKKVVKTVKKTTAVVAPAKKAARKRAK